jgi:glycosyltransferase involved in cell wall biosynthesis
MIKTKIMATISFAITVHNEHKELDKLLQQLVKSIREEDEIVVQMDITATEEVKAVVNSYKLTNYFHPLNKDFATFKNNLKSLCTKDWIFFIDADETLNYYFSKNIHEFLELNKGMVDLIGVPRVNKVNGLTQSHIDKWRWFVDDNGWVNWPDYQTRICANKPEIQWINKVHERLTGFKTSAQLPALEEWSLTHIKDIERQENQNKFYETI